MAKAKQEKPLCVNDLRHAEYYGMQESFDDLYARSRNGEKFTALMDLILKRENILLGLPEYQSQSRQRYAGNGQCDHRGHRKDTRRGGCPQSTVHCCRK